MNISKSNVSFGSTFKQTKQLSKTFDYELKSHGDTVHKSQLVNAINLFLNDGDSDEIELTTVKPFAIFSSKRDVACEIIQKAISKFGFFEIIEETKEEADILNPFRHQIQYLIDNYEYNEAKKVSREMETCKEEYLKRTLQEYKKIIFPTEV